MQLDAIRYVPRSSGDRSRSGPAWPKIAGVLLIFLLLFLAWRYTPIAEVITPDRVLGSARAVRHVAWAPFALIVLYTPAAFLMFPRPLLTMFAALAFGPWLGFVVSMCGILGSALATYGAGRSMSERTVRRIAGRRLQRTSAAVRRRGFLSVLAVSIAPVAPFPIVGIVSGAVRIKLRDYVLGTMLGMLPGTLATTVFAKQIEIALEHPERINYWIVALVIAVLVTLTLLARRWMSTVEQHA